MARRKTLTENVEAFVQRAIKRHTKAGDWAAVAEDFAFLGKFYEVEAEAQAAFKAEAEARRAAKVEVDT